MTHREFRNLICRLHNLDRSDVPFLSENDWPKFRDDPVRFFLRAGDGKADRIWAALVEDAASETRVAA